MTNETDLIVCPFCGKVETDLECAMVEGWEPYFYLSESEYSDRPVCPACSTEHLTDHAGDPILKPGHERPKF